MKLTVVLASIIISFTVALADTQIPLQTVIVQTSAIVSETLPGTVEPVNEADIKAELQRQAQEWTVRSLKANKVALQALTTTDNSPHAYSLQSEYRIPVTLPGSAYGINASNRRGRFMSARFILKDDSGKDILSEDVSLVWGDGHWTVGARSLRNVGTIEVLKGFVRKAVDRAVQHMKRDLAAQKRRL